MKHVLVLGGTSGIGLALAHGFKAQQWSVCAAGLNADSKSSAGGIELAEVDIRNQTVITELIIGQPRIDVLINAAGVIERDAEFEPDVFATVIDINLIGTMRACVAARPKLAAVSGCIINIASMLSFFGGGRVPAYSASKGGIAQLTKSLAIAWAAQNIRVNALAPGWIRTPLTQDLNNDAARSEAILARTPLARWGEPQDLVEPALFLASQQAGFITGTVLPVDGGYSIA